MHFTSCENKHDAVILMTQSFLILMISYTTHGKLEIDQYPRGPIREGQAVRLTCADVESTSDISTDPAAHVSSLLPLDPACQFYWTQVISGTPRGDGSSSIKRDDNLKVWVTKDRATGAQLKLTLNIEEVLPVHEAKYACTLICEHRVETNYLNLNIDNNVDYFGMGNEQAAMVVATGGIIIIATLMIGGLYLIVRDCLKLKPREQADEESDNASTTAEVQSETTDESSQPPPRYSVVVTVDEQGKTICDKDDRVSLLEGLSDISSVASNTSVFSYETLPNYYVAVEELASKGVHFDPTSLKPMPPAYNELSQGSNSLPLTSCV